MKKLTAILLLLILLFNIAGYRLFFYRLGQNATTRLENIIDGGFYSDDQLVEIKIPLNMPYYSDKGYEAVYGETEWGGKHYRYVKRKISGNILHLLCIPHDEKNRIADAENNFTKSFSDFSTDNSGRGKQTPSFVKLLCNEYVNAENNFKANQFADQHLSFIIANSALTGLFNPPTPGQPPETV